MLIQWRSKKESCCTITQNTKKKNTFWSTTQKQNNVTTVNHTLRDNNNCNRISPFRPAHPNEGMIQPSGCCRWSKLGTPALQVLHVGWVRVPIKSCEFFLGVESLLDWEGVRNGKPPKKFFLGVNK